MSHTIVSHQRLSRVLGGVLTVVIRAVEGLVGHQGDVLEQVLLEMLVTHVLPERVPGAELKITVIKWTPHQHMTTIIDAAAGRIKAWCGRLLLSRHL